MAGFLPDAAYGRGLSSSDSTQTKATTAVGKQSAIAETSATQRPASCVLAARSDAKPVQTDSVSATYAAKRRSERKSPMKRLRFITGVIGHDDPNKFAILEALGGLAEADCPRSSFYEPAANPEFVPKGDNEMKHKHFRDIEAIHAPAPMSLDTALTACITILRQLSRHELRNHQTRKSFGFLEPSTMSTYTTQGISLLDLLATLTAALQELNPQRWKQLHSPLSGDHEWN